MKTSLHFIRASISILLFLITSNLIHAQIGAVPTGTDTTCSPGYSVFQKIYKGAGDDAGYDLALAADSGYVIAGWTTSFGNGDYDGVLMKVNKKGDVVWTKTVGGAGFDVLYRIRRTSDNGFIIVGQTKSYGNTAGDAWLIKIDAGGTIQWSKKYGDGNVNGEIGYDVIQMSDGGYAFAGCHRLASGTAESFVTRTDDQGNVTWSKQYGNSGSDQATSLLEDGNSLVVVGFYQGNSFYDSYLMKLDKSNGTFQSIKGYDAEDRSTWFDGIRKTTAGYQVFSVITDNYVDLNQQQCIWNLASDGTVQSVRKSVIPGVFNISYAWIPQADGGFLAINGLNSVGSDIIFFKVNANGSLAWSKKFLRSGKQLMTNAVAASENGYAAIGLDNSSGTGNDFYFLRVDSVGDSGSCSGVNTTDVTIVTPTFVTTVPDVAPIGNVTINNPVITVGITIPGLVMSTICYNCHLILPPVPQDTVCASSTPLFQKIYTGVADDVGYEMALAADGGYVISGWTNSFGNGDYDGLVMKVNSKGNTVWNKAIGSTGYDYLSRIKRTSDDGFIICGVTKSYGNLAGDAWLVKIDADGNVQWSKKYGDGNVNGEIAHDVIQMSDGGYALCGSHRYGPGTAEGFVIRTDNNGNATWSKQYGISGSDQITSLIEDGGSIVVVGFYQAGSFYDSYLMKLDKTNGAIQSINGYDGDGRSTWFNKIIKTNSGYQVYAFLTDNYADLNATEAVWNLNTNGTVQNARRLVIPGNWTISSGWLGLPDGGFVAVQGENNNNSDLLFCKVNSNGTLAWSKKFSKVGKQLVYNVMAAGEFDGYAAIGYDNITGTVLNSDNVYMLRVDSVGNSGGCSGVNTNDLSVATVSNATPVPGIAALGNITLNNPVITVGVVNFILTISTDCFHCQYIPRGTLSPTGPGIAHHDESVFPNPAVSKATTLTIDAKYDDHASIRIYDLNGNMLYYSPAREIWKGRNNIRILLPWNIYTFKNYFIRIDYKDYASSIRLIVSD